ncbi:MAG: peptide chain release factor N(5)-glutamine methyltransferase [Desulfomonilaceae bacterium]|nr:peptide chain release factor N(5)-glutamine methyltransferase [Desulfomonilaceae bacterium]
MKSLSEKQSLWTVKDVLEWTADYFRTKGIRTARLDAEVLLAHSLRVDRLHLYLNLDRPLEPSERARYRELIQRRARREPVARIVGTKEFWSIPFRIVPGVLIPRPDTETLVEVVLREVEGRSELRLLEIGTGTGAVPIAVLKENPGVRMLATDVNMRALHITRLNARDAGVLQSLDVAAMDLFEGLRPGTEFDLICSNPPYIPTGDIQGLDPEVRDFEPLNALDGGPDGLDLIRRLVVGSKDHLAKGGSLILEIGATQGDAVRGILRRMGGMTNVETFHDLSGRTRVIKGSRLDP